MIPRVITQGLSMKKLLLAVMLALITPMLSAQTVTKAELGGDTIPFRVYQYQPVGGDLQMWANPNVIPLGFIDDVVESILDIPKAALTAAINEAKLTNCAALGNGSVTVSFGIDVGSKKIIIGASAGISITFECKDGVAV